MSDMLSRCSKTEALVPHCGVTAWSIKMASKTACVTWSRGGTPTLSTEEDCRHRMLAEPMSPEVENLTASLFTVISTAHASEPGQRAGLGTHTCAAHTDCIQDVWKHLSVQSGSTQAIRCVSLARAPPGSAAHTCIPVSPMELRSLMMRWNSPAGSLTIAS